MTWLGVDISQPKTHISNNTYEFAKRWIKNKIEISPLPLRGILNNLDSQHVVLQQIIDYTRKNTTLFKGNMLTLISIVYHKTFIGRKNFTFSNTYKNCYDFYHTIRYAYKMTTPSELRLYLNSKNLGAFNSGNMSEEVSPSFMKALLSLALHSNAEQSIANIENMYDNFIKSYSHIENFDITALADHPLLHALVNRTESIIKDFQEMTFKPELDLMDCLDMMRVESVDKLVSLKRDPKSVALGLDRL
jgi:hypothetical protein